MQGLLSSLDLECDTQKRHIDELQKFIVLLSSALTQEEVVKSPETAMLEVFTSKYNINTKKKAPLSQQI